MQAIVLESYEQSLLIYILPSEEQYFIGEAIVNIESDLSAEENDIISFVPPLIMTMSLPPIMNLDDFDIVGQLQTIEVEIEELNEEIIAGESVIGHISDSTYWMREHVDFGEVVTLYYNGVMTRSIPPQINVLLIG